MYMKLNNSVSSRSVLGLKLSNCEEIVVAYQVQVLDDGIHFIIA